MQAGSQQNILSALAPVCQELKISYLRFKIKELYQALTKSSIRPSLMLCKSSAFYKEVVPSVILAAQSTPFIWHKVIFLSHRRSILEWPFIVISPMHSAVTLLFSYTFI